MFGLGIWEIALILVVALLILGPEKLPKVARKLGLGMREVRRAATEFQRSLNTEVASLEKEVSEASGAKEIKELKESKELEAIKDLAAKAKRVQAEITGSEARRNKLGALITGSEGRESKAGAGQGEGQRVAQKSSPAPAQPVPTTGPPGPERKDEP